jgi:hypothetical protein
MTAALTPADLRRIGEALYGERWQTPLAGDLDVSDRTIRRWLDGSRAIPESLPGELARLIAARTARLQQLAAELRRAA